MSITRHEFDRGEILVDEEGIVWGLFFALRGRSLNREDIVKALNLEQSNFAPVIDVLHGKGYVNVSHLRDTEAYYTASWW